MIFSTFQILERPDCHRFKDHDYRAVYGRLRADLPAPTITTGFGSPGQGRFTHPRFARTITPHEAARLQFIPDFFRFRTEKRKRLQELIGNSVPPKMAYRRHRGSSLPCLRLAAQDVWSVFSAGLEDLNLVSRTAGFHPILFCEFNRAARAVLNAAWPNVELSEDIRKLRKLPPCEIITAGFPCQDLSQAGYKAGIKGSQFGLVNHPFDRFVASRLSLIGS